MLKLQERGLFVADLVGESPFSGFILGTNNEQDGAAFNKNVMVMSVAVNPGAAETVVIGGKTYTFVVSGATGDEINIGTTAAETLVSLMEKINADKETTLCTAYPLQSDTLAILIANEVDVEPTFTPDLTNIIAAIAWDVSVSEAILEDEDYFKIPITAEGSKATVLVERNAGTYQNFLY